MSDMSILLTISITILGIFILYILNKKNKRYHDYTLIGLNLICAGLLYASLRPKSDLTPFLFYLQNTLPFWLFGVFMLYAAQLLTHKPWQKYYGVFFLLSIPMTVFVTYDVFFAHEDFNNMLESRFLNPPFSYHLFYKGSMVFAIILSIFLLKRLKEYSSLIQNNFSYHEKIRLKWLKHYAIAMICIYAFSLFAFLAFNFGLVGNIDTVYLALNAITLFAFFYFSFHGIRQYNVDSIPILEESPALTPAQNRAKKETDNPKIWDEKSQKIYQELVHLFEETQLFTQPQLKLSDVAKQMELPPHQLSQIINAHYGKPFYDFVGAYRVHLLKERLGSPENKKFTILSLGLDCGFSSKASLNRVFKEHTGLTPSQYQKSHLVK